MNKKLKIIFGLILGIQLLDFLSTFIALNFFDNTYESNPLQAFLFNLGWHGWIFSLILTGTLLFILSFGIYSISNIINIKYGKKYGRVFLFFTIGFFMVLVSLTVIHNLRLII